MVSIHAERYLEKRLDARPGNLIFFNGIVEIIDPLCGTVSRGPQKILVNPNGLKF